MPLFFQGPEMKDLYFAADLLTVFRHDKYYSVQKNMSVALTRSR